MVDFWKKETNYTYLQDIIGYMSFTCLFIKDARILQHKSKARQFLFLDIKILKLSIFNVTKVNMNFFYHYMKNLTLLKWKISLRPNGFRLSNPCIPPPSLIFCNGYNEISTMRCTKKPFCPKWPIWKNKHNYTILIIFTSNTRILPAAIVRRVQNCS